jgi:predicted dinucleotide-binding enzyme
MAGLPMDGLKGVSVLGDTVGVLGSGGLGAALAASLARAGVPCLLGSRTPGRLVGGLKTVTHEEVLAQARIVVLAIPFPFMHQLPLVDLSYRHTVVDCSNRASPRRQGETAQAEALQAQLPPGVQLVKALNTLSAHQLETPGGPRLEVPLASDSPGAKATVGALVERLGYRPVDRGGLVAAREMEEEPLILFPAWRRPLAISLVLWMFLYLMQFGRYYLCQGPWGWGWYKGGHMGQGLTNLYHYDIIKVGIKVPL